MAERLPAKADVGASSPEQFAGHITAELARWSKMIKDLDLRAE
jgi:hypothetical protein